MDRLDAPVRLGAAAILPASRTGWREMKAPGRTAKLDAVIGDKNAAHVAMEAADVRAMRARPEVRRPTISQFLSGGPHAWRFNCKNPAAAAAKIHHGGR
jgi:hypothetical protein